MIVHRDDKLEVKVLGGHVFVSLVKIPDRAVSVRASSDGLIVTPQQSEMTIGGSEEEAPFIRIESRRSR